MKYPLPTGLALSLGLSSLLAFTLPGWAQTTTENTTTTTTTTTTTVEEIYETGQQQAPASTPGEVTPETTAPTEEVSGDTELIEEDPELPAAELELPSNDPRFQLDPNERPLEEDFNFMVPTPDPLFWRVELRNSTGYLSNVDQLAGAPGSLENRLSLTGILRYSLPTNTQILLRSQGFLNNYFNVAERDALLGIPLSVTASQWFADQFNVYTGWVPILSTGFNRPQSVTRFDNNFLLGGTFYQTFENKHILFAGYQLDYMLAEVEQARYMGNTFLVGYRHSLTPDLYLFADAQVQPRGYTFTPEFMDELRIGGNLALQWNVLRPWFIIEARTGYTQVSNFVSQERNAGIFSAGINLITAIQSL
jgi:hypothetical protein